MSDKPPKRKRGRPKGSKTKPKPAADLPLEEIAGAAAEAAGESKPGDSPPGSTGSGTEAPKTPPRRKRISKAVTAQIADALAEILQIPAVPAAMFGDDWMAEHFTVQGRALADRIAQVSERSPVLRAWCERAMEGESVAVLLMSAVMYAAPPLMHFGVLPGASLLGVPVLTREPPTGPVPAPETQPTPQREPVPAQQYGGEPAEAPSPQEPQDEKVVPNVHFVGGENGDGPPLWTEQMIG